MAHNTATKTLRDFILSTARAIVQFSSGALNLIFVVCAALRLNIKQTTGNYDVFFDYKVCTLLKNSLPGGKLVRFKSLNQLRKIFKNV